MIYQREIMDLVYKEFYNHDHLISIFPNAHKLEVKYDVEA